MTVAWTPQSGECSVKVNPALTFDSSGKRAHFDCFTRNTCCSWAQTKKKKKKTTCDSKSNYDEMCKKLFSHLQRWSFAAGESCLKIENMVRVWKLRFMLPLSSTGMAKAEPVLLSRPDRPDTDTDWYHMSFHAVTYRTSSPRHFSCSHTICQLTGRRWSQTKTHPLRNGNKEA